MVQITLNIPHWLAFALAGMVAISLSLDAWLKIEKHRLDRLKREREDAR